MISRQIERLIALEARPRPRAALQVSPPPAWSSPPSSALIWGRERRLAVAALSSAQVHLSAGMRTQLSARTFWILLRKFSSIQRHGVKQRVVTLMGPGSALYSSELRSEFS